MTLLRSGGTPPAVHAIANASLLALVQLDVDTE